MKKIIGIVGAVALITAVFFSPNTVASSQDMDLASLTSLNSADAECVSTSLNNGWCTWSNRCRFDVQFNCDPWY